MTKKNEAQWHILRAWNTWAPENLSGERLPNSDDAQKFYRALMISQPGLFTQKKQDKWGAVHECLLRHRKVVE